MLLSSSVRRHAAVTAYALRSLAAAPAERCAFFLPQLVQALRHDATGEIQTYLANAARSSWLFAHRLIWALQVRALAFRRTVVGFKVALQSKGW